MTAYDVLIISQSESTLVKNVQEFFTADLVGSLSVAREKIGAKSYRAIVVDGGKVGSEAAFEICGSLTRTDNLFSPPVLMLAPEYSLAEKIQAFECGCDDYVDASNSLDEVCARVTKSIFHSIANEQLTSRLESATETAYTVMADNSDLGASIQFLLAVHECDNLDQLGQQFINAIERYGLRCSIQMRTKMEVKNMEAHGMAKDLESQLLYQLKDSGRYVDFGRRTIMNFDRVSILIKNMPVDQEDKYGAIKDNTFSLVQGLNARVLAIEQHSVLVKERESLKALSEDVKDIIGTLKESYQHVMLEIAQGVDLACAKIEDRLPHLALTEADESFVQGCLTTMVADTTRVFNEGLKVDEIFDRLEESVKTTLSAVEEHSHSKLTGSTTDTSAKRDGGDTVELF